MSSFVSLKDVCKRYTMGEVTITASDHVSFDIEKGEFVVIVGPSGAGKTTILNMLGGMDTVTEGDIIVDGNNVAKYNNKELITYRRYDIGFVFQFYNLIQNLTAKENVELASQICKNPLDPDTVLKQVGLEKRENNFPAQLSGGEPTGALDYVTGKQILKLLQDCCRQNGMTVIVITHNLALTPMADKVIHINSSKVTGIEINENPTPVEQIEW